MIMYIDLFLICLINDNDNDIVNDNIYLLIIAQ